MPIVYVIDDRDERKIVAESIELELSKISDGWVVKHMFPLIHLSEYLSWINEEDIALLVLDERLTEVPSGDESGQTVDYSGHELVDFLRKHIPDFPLFIVASNIDDEEVKMRFGAVEGIIQRQDFNNDAEKYVPRMVRAGQRYLHVFEQELDYLSEFSAKLATGGSISEQDRKRARAVQEKLGIAVGIDEISTKREWLEQMSSLLQELDELKNEINKHITDE